MKKYSKAVSEMYSQKKGWAILGPYDVVFKKCERYWYAGISDLID